MDTLQKYFMLILTFLVCAFIATALTFNPGGDIDMKNRYNILNGGNFTGQKVGIVSAPTACPGGTAMTFFNGTTSVCTSITASTANQTANFSNLMIGNKSADGEGPGTPYLYQSCTQRPMVSNGNVTIYVPYKPVGATIPGVNISTIQEALCGVPYFLKDYYTIYVDGNTYTARENFTISQIYGSDDYKGGELKIRGWASSAPAKVGWGYFSDITGQGNPHIEHLNFTRGSSVYDGCQLCLFTTTQADVIEDYFDCENAQNTPQNCSDEYSAMPRNAGIRFGILAYGGSIVKVNGAHFANKTQWGIGAKQGSSVWVRDDAADGFTTGQAFYATIGNIYAYGANITSDISTSGSKINRVVTNQGIIQLTNVSDGTHNVVYGITELPEMERIQVGTSGKEWSDSLYRGFAFTVDSTNKQLKGIKKDSASDTTWLLVNRSNGYPSFQTDVINIATPLSAARSAGGCWNDGDMGFNSTTFFVCSGGVWKKAQLS
jgi:hypothetical protein